MQHCTCSKLRDESRHTHSAWHLAPANVSQLVSRQYRPLEYRDACGKGPLNYYMNKTYVEKEKMQMWLMWLYNNELLLPDTVPVLGWLVQFLSLIGWLAALRGGRCLAGGTRPAWSKFSLERSRIPFV